MNVPGSPVVSRGGTRGDGPRCIVGRLYHCGQRGSARYSRTTSCYRIHLQLCQGSNANRIQAALTVTLLRWYFLSVPASPLQTQESRCARWRPSASPLREQPSPPGTGRRNETAWQFLIRWEAGKWAWTLLVWRCCDSSSLSLCLNFNRRTGVPFHNFISWQDQRAADLVKSWNRSCIMKVDLHPSTQTDRHIYIHPEAGPLQGSLTSLPLIYL